MNESVLFVIYIIFLYDCLELLPKTTLYTQFISTIPLYHFICTIAHCLYTYKINSFKLHNYTSTIVISINHFNDMLHNALISIRVLRDLP